jgi:hypothetical protein
MNLSKRELYLVVSCPCFAVNPAHVLHVFGLVLVFVIGDSFPVKFYNSCEGILDFKLLLFVLHRSRISAQLEFTVG